MQRYLETRTLTSTSGSVGADLARHLLTRQHLGKTVIICDKPIVLISIVRKNWFRLTRSLQKERASTLNAEKILQLTHDITHMQRMEFAIRSFHEHPRADVCFVTPDQLSRLPTGCFSVYILEAPGATQMIQLIEQLPHMALVIDYSHSAEVIHAPLLPKRHLEELVPQNWVKVEQFLKTYDIDIRKLSHHSYDAEVINEALDTLLNVGGRFMRVAEEFLESLRLAQPLGTSSTDQQLYDLVATLNRRICALTPETLSQQFIQTLNDDDALSLHDIVFDRNFALAG